jgi:hypothetical protein
LMVKWTPNSVWSRNEADTPDRVGAEYCVSSCDLGVFMEEAAEAVSSGDLDVGVDGLG